MVCLMCVGGYRLPKDVFPEHYKLEVISYLGEKDNFNFDGKVWIEINVENPTQNVTLHSKDLTIREKDVIIKDISSNDAKELKVSNIKYEKDNDYLIIELNEPLVTSTRFFSYSLVN